MSEIIRSRVLHSLFYAVPILLVVYVLSIGPFYAMVTNSADDIRPIPDNECFVSYESFESIYAPLLWAGEKNLFIDDLIYDYMDFCYASIFPDSYSRSLRFF